MDFTKFINKLDKVAFENKAFRMVSLLMALTILLMGYFLVLRVENQKIIVMPPFVTLKEFWVSGENVSDSYLEMVADGIAYNVLNIAPERKPNTEFLYALTPAEHYNAVKGAIENQIKFIQNNGISQVFYTNGYDVKTKGHMRVSGVLKQYVGDKKMESSVHHLEITYAISGGRFWLKGIDLKKDGTKLTQEEIQ
ncbi:MAG: conjugal transfer protein TraE [Sulfurospirillum sp.]|nr:conjugal transfer protein TraE [Sulfurospirillum sp.]